MGIPCPVLCLFLLSEISVQENYQPQESLSPTLVGVYGAGRGLELTRWKMLLRVILPTSSSGGENLLVSMKCGPLPLWALLSDISTNICSESYQQFSSVALPTSDRTMSYHTNLCKFIPGHVIQTVSG